jgi:hypothetical protein
MPTFEGLTGPISFDTNGRRVNYSIDIYRSALNMPLAKVFYLAHSNLTNKLKEILKLDWNLFAR